MLTGVRSCTLKPSAPTATPSRSNTRVIATVDRRWMLLARQTVLHKAVTTRAMVADEPKAVLDTPPIAEVEDVRTLTVQLGDGELLARRTGVDVVYDLRAADCAHGGQGAPLAPVYHRALAARLPQRPTAPPAIAAARPTSASHGRTAAPRRGRASTSAPAAPSAAVSANTHWPRFGAVASSGPGAVDGLGRFRIGGVPHGQRPESTGRQCARCWPGPDYGHWSAVASLSRGSAPPEALRALV